jgi:hypothetical protein
MNFLFGMRMFIFAANPSPDGRENPFLFFGESRLTVLEVTKNKKDWNDSGNSSETDSD